MEHTSNGALDGLVVLDLTQFMAGPYGSQILGDMGAEIIKIETEKGDDSRTVPPYFHNGTSAYYLTLNRNKKNILLDLKSEKDYAAFLKLLEKADVVFDNYRPGVTKKLRVDYETLSKVNPRIICCSISGFGQYGPYKDRPAYDMVVQALGGVMSLTGEVDGRPVRAGIPIGDVCAGIYAVNGILAAVYERERSGMGQFIDISMLDVQVSMLTYHAAFYFMSGIIPGPQGRAHRAIPTYSCFVARDGMDILITANTPKMWTDLCEVLDKPELASDPRFESKDLRLKNEKELVAILNELFAKQDGQQLLDRMNSAGIPAAPIQNIEQALTDPQVLARNMVIGLTDNSGETVRVAGNPIKFSRSNKEYLKFPPKLGEDTEAILKKYCNN